MCWRQKITKSIFLTRSLLCLPALLLFMVGAKASSFMNCDVQARLINIQNQNKVVKLRDGSEMGGVEMTVQLVGKPINCTGHGSKYQGNEQLLIAASLPSIIKAEHLIPQSIVTLNYHIMDSLTPEGAVEGVFWTLLKINKTPL